VVGAGSGGTCRIEVAIEAPAPCGGHRRGAPCCSPVPHRGRHRGRPLSPPSPAPRSPPVEAVVASVATPVKTIPTSVATTHRGRPRPRLCIHYPSRMPPEHSVGRQPCRGGAERLRTTAQRPQAHSGGCGAWCHGVGRRIGFPASDGAHGCSTADIMVSSGSRTEHGQLLELVSGRGKEGC
jgi:hypothetical protein